MHIVKGNKPAHWMNTNKEHHDLSPDRSWAAWDSILECMLSNCNWVNQAQLNNPGLFRECLAKYWLMALRAKIQKPRYIILCHHPSICLLVALTMCMEMEWSQILDIIIEECDRLCTSTACYIADLHVTTLQLSKILLKHMYLSMTPS